MSGIGIKGTCYVNLDGYFLNEILKIYVTKQALQFTLYYNPRKNCKREQRVLLDKQMTFRVINSYSFCDTTTFCLLKTAF